MNHEFRQLMGAAMREIEAAMEDASRALDGKADAANNWRAEVIRLRELLWHVCPSGKPECPHCAGAGRITVSGRGYECETTICCSLCQGAGWQEIGTVGDMEHFPMRPHAQAAADDDNGWVPA